MFDFKKIAENTLGLNTIETGRKRVKTEEIADRELTIVGFDFIVSYEVTAAGRVPAVDKHTGEVKERLVILFKEMPDKFYWAGKILKDICRAWAAEFGGDTIKTSEELEKSGGVRVSLYKDKTKDGNQIVRVKILD